MTDKEHQHDLVRVENEAKGLAWDTCRSCPFKSEPEPRSPMTQEELDEFNAARAATPCTCSQAVEGTDTGVWTDPKCPLHGEGGRY